MVILWTNLEGEKVEPSPTAQRPASEHGGRSNNGGQLSLKRRVQVALKPSLPSLFLPLVKQPNNSSDSNGHVVAYSPGPTTDSVSLPSSLDSSPTLPDDDPLRLVVIRLGDLSPDSGVVIQFEPTPSPSVAFDPVRPTALPAQRAQPPKTLPIIYGTRRNTQSSPASFAPLQIARGFSLFPLTRPKLRRSCLLWSFFYFFFCSPSGS